MATDRATLHKNALNDFIAWAKTKGYIEHPLTRHPYEVARLEYYTPQGNNPHLVFYKRERTDHITCEGNGRTLMLRYMRERKGFAKADVIPIDRGRVAHR